MMQIESQDVKMITNMPVTTVDSLSTIFTRTGEPIWSMIGRWAKSGLEMGVDGQAQGAVEGLGVGMEEFFVERDLDISVMDPEFWGKGCALRSVPTSALEHEDDQEWDVQVPICFSKVAQGLLRLGKGIGLLRAIGIDASEVDGGIGQTWESFTNLCNQQSKISTPSDLSSLITAHFPSPVYASVGIDRRSTPAPLSQDLEYFIADRLTPLFDIVQRSLQSVLFDRCGIISHLHSMEGVLLMQRGWEMSEFCDGIFDKVRFIVSARR